ncbi:ATP-grasp domain-containing protein [Kitasatospora sp. NBC_00315]|uniref:ATP-grasp domain-containing protein n=1 Tax=Kitasatospora sp. NBC_00315 TaxID=2975963 RepID=UPI00324B2479
MTVPAMLFPADPLTLRRPDPHFAGEARRWRELGGEYALIDHDALLAGEGSEALRRVPVGIGPLWYRGWMIPTSAYERLASALDARGGGLLTTPAGYASAHELPGWYPAFDGATPTSVWLPVDLSPGAPGPAPAHGALAAAAARLGGGGPAIVKDYVKSRKHEWAEACFVPDLGDLPALERVVARFVELQAEFLAGGVVLRRFEEYTRTEDGRANEARVWWLDGEPVLVGPHPDTPDLTPEPDLSEVRPLVRALGCRFVTTDLAHRADGSGWRVVEVGDGQVSGLPSSVDATVLLSSLATA